MSHHFHAIVWIDHHEARILDFNPDDTQSETVRPRHPVKHLHVKAGTLSSWRAPEDKDYFDEVATKLADIGEALLVGPANAKFELYKYLQAKHPQTAQKVVGIETVDHPTNGELVNYAKAYFMKADRMLPQIAE